MTDEIPVEEDGEPATDLAPVSLFQQIAEAQAATEQAMGAVAILQARIVEANALLRRAAINYDQRLKGQIVTYLRENPDPKV